MSECYDRFFGQNESMGIISNNRTLALISGSEVSMDNCSSNRPTLKLVDNKSSKPVRKSSRFTLLSADHSSTQRRGTASSKESAFFSVSLSSESNH